MKVIIIDSGINKNYQRLCDGGYRLMSVKGSICRDENIFDEGLHGTMCSSIIKQIEPKTKIYHIKIMNDGRTSSELLLAALKDLREIECDIINISMATENGRLLQEMNSVCADLEMQGKIIVASAMNGSKKPVYPACLKSVMGVSGSNKIKNQILYYNEMYECSANIEPEIISLDKNNDIFFMGKSKATAIVSGVCASIAKKKEKMTKKDMVEIIQNEPFIYERKIYCHTLKIKKYLETIYGDKVYMKLYKRCKGDYKECIKVVENIEKKYPKHGRIYYSDFASIEQLQELFENRWSMEYEK